MTDEWFLEDTSESIKAVFKSKRKRGEYIGAYALYGYKKDPKNKNHLIIDENVSDNIKKIFDLYEKGYGAGKIAEYLNEKNIVSPARYKKGLGYTITTKYDTGLWYDTTILKILKNEMYIRKYGTRIL